MLNGYFVCFKMFKKLLKSYLDALRSIIFKNFIADCLNLHRALHKRN